MKSYWSLVCLALVATPLSAAELGERIFSDNFERTESQEVTDEPGKGWGTNSKSRASGNKQVDLRDGAMHIKMHATADHGVSVTQPFEFTNGAVTMKFMLENEKDSLGLDFADLQFKPVHAGHLFVVRISPKQIQIADLKNGSMDLKFREARLAGALTPEQKKKISTTESKIAHKTTIGQWHDLKVEVQGDELIVSMDGSEVGRFASAGFAHPTKRLLRVAVNREAIIDDVVLYRNK